MLMDTTGELGREHVRDLQRSAAAYRATRGIERTPLLRRLARRSQLRPARDEEVLPQLPHPHPAQGNSVAKSAGVDPEALAAAGLYDPGSPGADERRELLEFLIEQGCSIEEMHAAHERGRLFALAGDR